jgi:hypothetical protein
MTGGGDMMVMVGIDMSRGGGCRDAADGREGKTQVGGVYERPAAFGMIT